MPKKQFGKYRTQRVALLRRLAAGPDDYALTDAEILELQLASDPSSAHSDSLAQHLLTAFGSLPKVIDADAAALQAIDGMTPSAITRLKLLSLTLRRVLRATIGDQPVIGSGTALREYCMLAMGNKTVEEFRVLFLNHRYALLADEVMQRGTINHTPVYPREIVRRSLELGAGSVILLHNHPSGDPAPSKADIDITIKIIEAAATVNVSVHDHMIISDRGHFSFLAGGLLSAPSSDASSSDANVVRPAPAASRPQEEFMAAAERTAE